MVMDVMIPKKMKTLEDDALYEMCYEPISENVIQKRDIEKYKVEIEKYKVEIEKYKVEIEKYKVEINECNEKNHGLIELITSYNNIFKLYIV
jgi:hypothetical protein